MEIERQDSLETHKQYNTNDWRKQRDMEQKVRLSDEFSRSTKLDENYENNRQVLLDYEEDEPHENLHYDYEKDPTVMTRRKVDKMVKSAEYEYLNSLNTPFEEKK
jgi:hypothetical protein